MVIELKYSGTNTYLIRGMDSSMGDGTVYTPIDYDGQSPVPKCQAITDMDAGTKAVEYFIRTGERYPGIDWAYYS